VKQTVCKSAEHLTQLTDSILTGKGEGVIIKDPKSRYEGHRSYSMLKVKKFDDAEATVIGHEKGTGRCSQMLGALKVREKDGTTFKVGSGFTDQLRQNPPKKGTVITFKF
jgi:DNA ligase-1